MKSYPLTPDQAALIATTAEFITAAIADGRLEEARTFFLDVYTEDVAEGFRFELLKAVGAASAPGPGQVVYGHHLYVWGNPDRTDTRFCVRCGDCTTTYWYGTEPRVAAQASRHARKHGHSVVHRIGPDTQAGLPRMKAVEGGR